MRGVWGAAVAAMAMLVLPAAIAGEGDPNISADRILDAADRIADDPQAAVQDPAGALQPVLPADGGGAAPPPPLPERDEDPGFGDSLRDAFGNELLVMGLAGLGAVLLGIGGLAFVTRHISPKEALKNPQRAMLYGFVRGHPGVHLKKLSEEFAMKTSSILWHVRKLEAAELVHSERSNGFRVFYPVEGGIEMKRVSRALSALQNANARAIL
ncbi:MAG TPA: hypothetical protein VI796_02540, partial [Candidatus Thermoplasmatota archaeon]|nr:hypothetical protein [Candidatus Thermoplasmatota archaeon]